MSVRSTFLSITGPRVFIPLCAIGFLVATGFSYNAWRGSPRILLATVSEGTVVETISVSGRVRALQSADLTIHRGGRIIKISKNVGDAVAAGDIILETGAEQFTAAVDQVKSTLAREKTRLDQLVGGTRPEELAIARTINENAISIVDNAQATLLEKVKSMYQVGDTVIRNTVDQFINNPTHPTATLNFPVTDPEFARLVAQERYLLEADLVALRNSIPVDARDVSTSTIAIAQKTLDNIAIFLGDFAEAASGLKVNPVYSEAASSVLKSSVIASARSAITTAVDMMIAANQKVIQSLADARVAAQQLAIKQAGGSAIDIKMQKSAIDSAKATIANAMAQVEETLIRAPFDGIITRQDAEIGQTIQAGMPVVSIMTEGKFEVVVNIPERSISKVKVGNHAIVTIDSLESGAVFNATVTSIDLAERIIDGAVAYRARLTLNESSSQIKSGMTARAVITTSEKSGVVVVPEQAMSYKDGAWYVKKSEHDTVVDILITRGIRGAGVAEVISGLVPGDQIQVSN